jgi:hypothetical protein
VLGSPHNVLTDSNPSDFNFTTPSGIPGLVIRKTLLAGRRISFPLRSTSYGGQV